MDPQWSKAIAEVRLPHFPSTETLQPKDAILQAGAMKHAEKFGVSNLQAITALAQKENLVDECIRNTTGEAFDSNEIVSVLSIKDQGQQHKKSQIQNDPLVSNIH
jgi:hypothetical protein